MTQAAASRMRAAFPIVILTLAAAASGAAAPVRRIDVATLVGRVVDSATQAPLANADVGIKGLNDQPTDIDGYFTFDSVATGPTTITVRRKGYFPGRVLITVAADRQDTIQIKLRPAGKRSTE